MKILYTTTVGDTMSFFEYFIKRLVNEGHTVDIATNESSMKVPDTFRTIPCKIFPVSWDRSPVSTGNLSAVFELKKIIEKGNYDIVHCHTPICAAITRIVCNRYRKQGLKVIYTAHGFHFYSGAPIINWIIYYPIEKFCSRLTDVLITINKEDYLFAKRKMKAKCVTYVPGVGIDTEKFRCDTGEMCDVLKELDLTKDAYVVLSAGELNTNKNHQIVIKAIEKLSNPSIHYLIAGVGDQKDNLKALAIKCGVSEQVHLLGFRDDIAQLYKTADLYVLPSIREGLNVSVIEAMASGLPCVVSDIRGNIDLIDKKNGLLFNPSSSSELANAINYFYLRNTDDIRANNIEKSKRYDQSIVTTQIKNIYISLSRKHRGE